jgi:primosomal protein N' (replication factor Y)
VPTSIAKIVVDLSLNREFDYLVPQELEGAIQVGAQVLVPFGRRHVKGYVVGLAEHSERTDLKPILEKVGRAPLIDQQMLDLAKWMASYYLAPVEQAVRTVLPSAVRKKGPAFKELLFVAAEPLSEDAEAVEKLRKKAPKQAMALDALRASGPTFVQKLQHAAHATEAAFRGLEKKGFVRLSRKPMYRDPHEGHELLRTQPLELMPQQADALKLVIQSIETRNPSVVLLFGVTGSGKTEVYLQAIDHVRKQGRGAIVLVPEIALTPQTVDRFRGRFGDCIAVLHSELSEGERHDEWHRVHEGRATIVIGARSALFAPIHNWASSSWTRSTSRRTNRKRRRATMRAMSRSCAGTWNPARSYWARRHRRWSRCTMCNGASTP